MAKLGRVAWLPLALSMAVAAAGVAGHAHAQAASPGVAHAVMTQDVTSVTRLLPKSDAASMPDLFGFTTVRLSKTLFDKIWNEAAWSPMPDDAEVDAAVSRLSALPVRERAREANAWVNARVHYQRDPLDLSHRWGNLSRVLKKGVGERHDIAIAKLQLLAAAGVPRKDMFLVLVEDWRLVAEDYLLAVRDGGQVYVLDSKQDEFEDPAQTSRYRPLVALGSQGRWIFGRRRHDPAGKVNVNLASLRGLNLGYSAAPQANAQTVQPVADRRR
ncbi:MAG TPA: hypothetical protein VFE03_05185 [Caulobacteraceae bacterium]|nr:hypothetical protein [Caulobacteraceae bacterium]